MTAGKAEDRAAAQAVREGERYEAARRAAAERAMGSGDAEADVADAARGPGDTGVTWPSGPAAGR